MANTKAGMDRLMEIDGSVGCCLVDSSSGMVLAQAGGGSSFNLEVAAAGNTEVVRAKRKTMKALELNDGIEDILITLGRQLKNRSQRSSTRSQPTCPASSPRRSWTWSPASLWAPRRTARISTSASPAPTTASW